MNYRHAFHAGNFADVHKHVVLFALLEHLHKKSAPFFFLDTHAGRGTYDLRSAEAQRGDEWSRGIGRLQEARPMQPLLQRFLALLDPTAHRYHGSPLLAAATLRENDRAVFVEKLPEEAAELKRALGSRRHVSVLVQDGYAALKAQLPPKENRGLVLIDPPYEAESEFETITQSLQFARERWPNGMYCVWYPLKADGAERRMHRALVEAGIKKILVAELSVRPADSPFGLNGSGVLLRNPPWQFDDQLRSVLPGLHDILAPDGAGGIRVEWLAGE